MQLEEPVHCPTRLVALPAGEAHEFPLPDSPYTYTFVHSAGMTYQAQAVRECLQKGQAALPPCGRVNSERSGCTPLLS